ncbi:MAG: OpgC domain-containing protein [Casimicrobiaceae bacterium]
MTRRLDIDALRGLMLVMMTLTHLPTRFASPLGQPLGFVSSAEGFVFLSAFMVGWVYSERANRDGLPAMRRALWRRAGALYTCQIGLLLFLLTVVASIARTNGQPAITNLVSFFGKDPATALTGGLVLVYNPPLLDILPMYVVLLAATPWLLSFALRRGWWPIIALSTGLWVAAQFDAGRALYEALAGSIGLDLPVSETGAFSLFAWQLVWIGGLWLGALKVADTGGGLAAPRWAIAPALAVAAVCLVWRHVTGQVPYPHATGSELNALFDKWHLAPLRLVNFLALVVLVLHFGPRLARRVPLAFLARLGAASLPVFCAHLVICLLALAFLGDRYDRRSWIADIVLLIGAFAALYAVAEFVQLAFRSTGDSRGRRDALSARSAKSPISITRTPQR